MTRRRHVNDHRQRHGSRSSYVHRILNRLPLGIGHFRKYRGNGSRRKNIHSQLSLLDNWCADAGVGMSHRSDLAGQGVALAVEDIKLTKRTKNAKLRHRLLSPPMRQ